MLIDFLFDYETRSELNLKDVGAVKYSMHESTVPTVLVYTFGQHTALKVWLPLEQPVPSELAPVFSNPEKYKFVAWNVFFDINIWTRTFARVVRSQPFSIKSPPIANIEDAMALSNHFRTGSSLESAAVFHRLPSTKDKEGHKIMLKQAKPGKDGNFVELTPEEKNSFIRYAVQDVNLLREIYYSLPPLPASERYAYEWTLRRNLEGVRIDMPLVVLLSQLLDFVIPKQEARFRQITGLKVRSPKLIKFFGEYYPGIESLDAENMEELYNDTREVPKHIREALEIKYLIGSASIAKIRVALNRQVGGRLHEILAYHKTHTKRWAGMGIQIQNFPRPEQKPADKLDFNLDQHSLVEDILKKAHTEGLKEPVKFVKNLLRRIFIAEEGKVLCAGDFSKIEPTVLFWLCGLGGLPWNWYEQLAADIFCKSVEEIGKDSEDRQIGKMGQLSCGYGAGWATLQKQVKKGTGLTISEDMSKLTVNTYRRKYPPVVRLWADLENAFRKAIAGEGTKLCDGKVLVAPSSYRGVPMVVIRLPSGGCLYYHNARIRTSIKVNKAGKETYKESICYDSDEGNGKVLPKDIYGGLLCENVTSAIAREIMKESMFRLEAKGFGILNLVHDEIWGSFDAGREKEFSETMCERPRWAQDMEISSGDETGVRYLK
jgi:DNA polymerase